MLLLVMLMLLPPPRNVVVVVNPANPMKTLSVDQAAQYFLGRATNLTPLDQGERTPLRQNFYQKVAGKDSEQVKAIWSKIVFTGRGFPPRQYGNASDLKRAVAANPDAIAYLDEADVDDTVKVVLSLP